MTPNLLENNYIIIKNFIEKDKAQKLASEFKEFAISQNYKGDHQVPDSHSVYNYMPFLRLVVEKIDEVSEISGEKVLPICAYSRVYRHGNILHRHKDRPGCEISLTVNLSGDHEWPIWIKTPLGKEVSVNLDSGDAVMYLGNKAEHWREKFNGTEYVQVFMHYISANGPYSSEHDEFKNYIIRNPL